MLKGLGRRGALTAALSASLVLAFVAVSPVAAIRYGDNDNNDHPFVGLMVAQDATGNPLWRCSGTLLSDTVFITAGHCVAAPAAHIEVWFSAGPEPLGAGYPASGPNRCAGITGYPCTGDVGGDPHENPSWDPGHFWLHDVGIVTFDSQYTGTTTYGQLPSVEQLDSLHAGRSTWFTAVGYGLQAAFPDAAAWKDQSARIRKVGYPWLYQINTNFSGEADLILSDNASSGGTCFGDSGGPNLQAGTNIVLAVNSYGPSASCNAVSYSQRLDTPSVYGFIAHFVH